jgi:hypothetical protein
VICYRDHLSNAALSRESTLLDSISRPIDLQPLRAEFSLAGDRLARTDQRPTDPESVGEIQGSLTRRARRSPDLTQLTIDRTFSLPVSKSLE